MEKDVLLRLLSAGRSILFTRQVSKTDVALFGAAGFRFAPLTQISHALSIIVSPPSKVLPNEDLAGH